MRFMMPRERSTRPAATALILMLALAIACGGSAETTGTQPLLPALEPTSTAAPPLTLEPTSTTAPRPTLEPTSTAAPRPTLEPTRGTPIPTLNPRQIQATQTVRVSYPTPVPTLPMTVLYRTPVPTLPMTVLYRTPVPTLPMTVLYRTPVPTLPMIVSYPTPVPTEPPPTEPATTPAPEAMPALRSTTFEAFIGHIPSFDAIVTHFRFFESGYDRVPLEERVFEASFDQRTARYIDWQLEFTAVVLSDELVMELRSVLYNSEKDVVADDVLVDKVNPGQEFGYLSWGLGYEEPGHWVPGHYWVEVFLDGTLVAAGGFEVVGP